MKVIGRESAVLVLAKLYDYRFRKSFLGRQGNHRHSLSLKGNIFYYKLIMHLVFFFLFLLNNFAYYVIIFWTDNPPCVPSSALQLSKQPKEGDTDLSSNSDQPP